MARGNTGWPMARGGEIWAVRLLGSAFAPSGMGFAPRTCPKKTFGKIMKIMVFTKEIKYILPPDAKISKIEYSTKEMQRVFAAGGGKSQCKENLPPEAENQHVNFSLRGSQKNNSTPH